MFNLGGALDYQTQSSYEVTLATGGVSVDHTLTITDVDEGPLAIALTHTVTSLAEDADTSSSTKMGDIVITGGDGGTNTALSFETNTGSLSNGVLTLLDTQYADIPAIIMGDWPGTLGFELSVEIKGASGNGKIGEVAGAALIQRSSTSSSGHGPMVFLWDNGSIQVRLHKSDKLDISDAVASWDDWVKLRFVLDV